MCAAHVIAFGETTRTMTYEEGLAFVERTRRQLARFSIAAPGGGGDILAPQRVAAIREQLDKLERDFRNDLEVI